MELNKNVNGKFHSSSRQTQMKICKHPIKFVTSKWMKLAKGTTQINPL